MKKIISLFAVCLVSLPSFAATQENQARRSMTSQMVMAAPRATASTAEISAMAAVNTAVPLAESSSVRVEPITKPSAPAVNNREKEKAACINNNIGVGNTFVWASRYSNSNNYASMVEDTENPDNNICFVKVEIKSNDPKISVSDVPSRYFEMGRDITCGDWADEGVLRQRILDAKKSARTWATVGGVVGGAGVGVGIMELFGNRWIGGSVEGQKDLTGDERLLSHLLVLKRDKDPQYNDFIEALETMQKECKSIQSAGAELPDECKSYNYEYLLNAKNIN